MQLILFTSDQFAETAISLNAKSLRMQLYLFADKKQSVTPILMVEFHDSAKKQSNIEQFLLHVSVNMTLSTFDFDLIYVITIISFVPSLILLLS